MKMLRRIQIVRLKADKAKEIGPLPVQQPVLSTNSHYSQRKKRWPKERNDYYYSFNQLNPEGTIHLLLKGDILTSYEHIFYPIISRAPAGGG